MSTGIARRRLLLGAAGIAAMGSFRGAVAGQRAGSRWEPTPAENIQGLDESTLRRMAQLGLKWVDLQGAEGVDGKGWWSVADIRAAQERCGQFGLKLACMTIPIACQRKSLMGWRGRDEEIEPIERSMGSMGAAGVPELQDRALSDLKCVSLRISCCGA